MFAWRARFLMASVSGTSSMTTRGMIGAEGAAAVAEPATSLVVPATSLVDASGWVAALVDVMAASVVAVVEVVLESPVAAVAGGFAGTAALVGDPPASVAAGGLFWADTAKLPARSPLYIAMMILGFMSFLLFQIT